ncbi:c6 zinc finger domain containing protein [Niveomyces insectorum RCEF 264]|uniref:C6 zinc finger domain containing protein n=1 Tax=Niveomyces insectorum RCEF 264 TaxID=1081102 RepID=A0A167XY27_9HYPO|nr:c6 zinc finger domain containing protein [Niveomyces insectorum RCEF 264]
MNASSRKRARLACNPCRERKRKCDGSCPCATCTTYGYECYYAAPAAVAPTASTAGVRKRRSRIPHPSSTSPTNGFRHGPLPQPQPPSPDSSVSVGASAAAPDRSSLVQRMEGNSGAAFVRRLGLKIDPTRAPKLNLFGWNVGARQLSAPFAFGGMASSALAAAAAVLPVVDITSCEHCEALARVYFDKVHVCYGFFDQDTFFTRLKRRFQQPTPVPAPGSHAPDVYDSVLAGVAALGCLFSQRTATLTELQLVAAAVRALNMHQLVGPPSLDLITGWILRTVYLRLTDTPYAVWIASCTMMHLVEAAGLLADVPPVLPLRARCDPELERRMVGVAHHLNVWTSFDLGLSRVAFLKTEASLPPEPAPGDITAELLGLLPMSVSMDPARTEQETDLTSTLVALLARQHTPGPSLMAQCNLVLCVLRRLHTQNLDISSGLADQVLALLKRGLVCARDLAAEGSPWHQVSNMPFQTVCVLLVMDTRAGLATLPEAMRTIRFIASVYDTERMREAYRTACLLVRLHQQRRKDDVALLGDALGVPPQPGQQTAEPGTTPVQQPSTMQPSTQIFPSSAPPPPPLPSSSPRPLPPSLPPPPPAQPGPGDDEFSWLGALVADLPGLQRVDFEQFLNADMIDGPSLLYD